MAEIETAIIFKCPYGDKCRDFDSVYCASCVHSNLQSFYQPRPITWHYPDSGNYNPYSSGKAGDWWWYKYPYTTINYDSETSGDSVNLIGIDD